MFLSGQDSQFTAPQYHTMKTNQNIVSFIRFIVVALLIATLPLQHAKAGHLIGGELTYSCTGNDFYDITLKVFRDCACVGCAIFDNPAYVFIYDDLGTTIDILEMNFPAPIPLTYDLTINPCLELPPNLCVEEAVYTKTVYLPDYGGGYDIVHQRCCRNDSILNTDQASTFGATFYAHIPEPSLAVCNSNPYFTNFPPIALCINDSLIFNHSATDIDGDSLFYELCAPFDGASSTNPQPDPSTPPPPPPYTEVIYEPPFAYDSPLNGSPALSIDPQTGVLTGTPTAKGQYVVGVCVSEYRNGLLLSTNKRDFQFNVVDCNAIITAALPAYVLNCDDTVKFVNNSLKGTFYLWDFGDGNTDTLEEPVYAYQDTGIYNVQLIVNAGWPCSDTAYTTVNIFPDLISNYSYQMHCADSDITFNDLSSTAVGSITSWSWSFGDGGSSTNASPTYNYTEGGVYNLQLTIINDTGCFDTKKEEIYVYEEPPASIFFNSICADSVITFTDDTQLDSGSVVSWDWDIGGFTTGTASSITYTFDDPGTYNLTLSVVTDHGCTGTAIQTIVVDSCFLISVDDLIWRDNNAPYLANPNPSSGIFHIESIKDEALHDIAIEVFNITGQRILKMSNVELGETRHLIDLKPFGSGVYFLKILEGQQSYSLKLVVD